MPTKFTYLLIDFCCVIIPFIFSFHKKILFYKNLKPFFLGNLIVSSLFIIWDIYFTKWGVWRFNEHYVCGIYLANLPIEEVLFFVCIPFSSIFTYHCFKLFFPREDILPIRVVSMILIVVLLIISITQYTKLYTVVCFVFLLIMLIILEFIVKTKWLSHFYLMYLAILLPFFIVNGLLTGTGLDEPVVIYNNSENMGIRMLTIPVEDVFYGMSLLLLNTYFYEFFSKERKQNYIGISI